MLLLSGAASSCPVCPAGCEPSSIHHQPHFKHVSELQASSVAPWSLVTNTSEDREPQHITHAVCEKCTVADMTAKPIYIKISVYQKVRGTPDFWCKCPYELAVGCTNAMIIVILLFMNQYINLMVPLETLHQLRSDPPVQPLNMQNDAGEFVDLYVPRKCSASNRIIGAKDHASIQINIAEVDKVTGRFNGQFKTYAICGAIRRMGESDDSILRLARNDNVVAKNF
ncbi:uncharacterized protein V6R79_004820 [Siganus canaliculatus]